MPPGRPDRVFAATLDGAFVGGADGTGWKPLPSHPAWWGAITAFGFAPDRQALVFAVTHEGVVAGAETDRRQLGSGRRVPERGAVGASS